jgi:hypothetical protein
LARGGRAQAPTGPRARPREAGHLAADFSQEDQRAKVSTAQVKSRDRGRGAWAMGQRGRPASLTRGRKGGRRAIGPGYRRGGRRASGSDRARLSNGGRRKGAGRPREGAQIPLNKCSPKFCSVGEVRPCPVENPLNKFSPNFCSVGRRARDGKTTEQISGEHLTP